MAAVTVKQEWAMTTWAEKDGEGVVWAPVGNAIGNEVIDGNGRKYGSNHYGSAVPRRPYKTEADDSTGITYIMYEDDTGKTSVPVIRITEETASAEDEEA